MRGLGPRSCDGHKRVWAKPFRSWSHSSRKKTATSSMPPQRRSLSTLNRARLSVENSGKISFHSQFKSKLTEKNKAPRRVNPVVKGLLRKSNLLKKFHCSSRMNLLTEPCAERN
jgi:hypothetical protein